MITVNKWHKARDFYADCLPEIMAEKSNEWGIDPYAFESSGIRMTPIESWLWYDIRAVDVVLYPQFPIGPFIVDFANPVAKLAVECDGAAFHKDVEKDARRDDELRAMGWTVYRISGKDCRDGVDSDEPSKSKARSFVRKLAMFHNIRRGT